VGNGSQNITVPASRHPRHGMFKKRERPGSARKVEDAGANDGEAGKVPIAEKKKRQLAGSGAGSAEGRDSGLLGATTRRNDADINKLFMDKMGDTALTGLKANGEAAPTPGGDAFRSLHVDTPIDHDNRAVLERNQVIHKGLKDGTLEAGLYRGLKGYKQYAEKGEGAIAASKFSGQLGPLRGSQTMFRSTLRIEYIGTTGEGGICKDYKETGYCGFGDSCKFLHDRGDYKPSYMLEKEWDDKQKAIEEKKRLKWEKRMQRKALAKGEAKQGSDESSSDLESKSGGSDSEEALPGACPNCDTKWEECKSIPIITICGHYFCEDCAMTNFATSPKCMKCEGPTNGIFNSADAIDDKIKVRKALAAQKKMAKTRSGQARQSQLGVLSGGQCNTGYDMHIET